MLPKKKLFRIILFIILLFGAIILVALPSGADIKLLGSCRFSKIAAATATSDKPEGLSISDESLETVQIPKPSDWVDYGPVLEAGKEGSWDFLWAGATPVGVIKKDQTYYFYYVAGDGYRSFDGGPRHRSIGVATSQDGIHFDKYAGNPVMTYSPLGGEEEGANSAGIALDGNGDFVMYYGAAEGADSLISADGRVATSRDGFNFNDVGIVLNHINPLLYGFGDEIFPQAAFQHDGTWSVYYAPNGVPATGTLGMAWGTRMDKLPGSTQVQEVISGERPFGIWGNVIWLAPDEIALFIQRLRWPDTFVEVRTASPDTPYEFSEPVERYDIPDLKRGTVYLDRQRNTWFMYYNDFDRSWKVKLAPTGEPDTTPPSKPTNLSTRGLSHHKVGLVWETASDPDTGVVIYHIYRDGVRIGSTKNWSFSDIGLEELQTYIFEVSAVNFHGVEGLPASIEVTTPADVIPPLVDSATTNGNPNRLVLKFNEPVETASAETITNYAISGGVNIVGAALSEDSRSVMLETTEQFNNRVYTLTVSNVHDRAIKPNLINPAGKVNYTHSSIPGQMGYWNMEQSSSNYTYDLSSFGNDGRVNGAILDSGYSGGALHFDGVDDYVIIENSLNLRNLTDSSFTFSAWVHPDGVPPEANPFGILQRVSGHPSYYFGLSYHSNQEFHARIITNPGEAFVTLVSGQFDSNSWHHVVMVVDDANKSFHLYVDGVPVDGSPIHYSGALFALDSNASENHIAGEYYIGSNKPDLDAGSFYTQYFRGGIDEVRIYQRGLTSAEVNNLYNAAREGEEVFIPLMKR